MQRDVPMLRIRKQLPARRKGHVITALLCVSAVLLLLGLGYMAPATAPPAPLLAANCVEFVQTRKKALDGPPQQVLPCDHTLTRKVGGYCVCEGSMAVPALPTLSSKATCQSLCASTPAAQAIPIPSSSDCPSGTPDFFQWPSSAPIPQLPSSNSKASAGVDWWLRLGGTLNLTDPVVLPPGPRNKTHDFVAKNFSMQPSHIAHVQEQWRSFSAAAEAVGSPVDTFTGRGIAILSGAAPYLVPSLVALKALRRTGCTLPVEMWLPEAEAPPPDEFAGLQRGMEQLGAQLLLLPIPPALTGQAGYFLKAVVVAVSSFQEVLFLDADNVPVADPTPLFLSEEFQRTGALFWRDFWDATWAPDAPVVLGVSSEQVPSFTIDSGQMLLDKSRVWVALVSALFFNIHGYLFYPLFTNYMGLGDKETFAFAMIAHDVPYSVVEHRTHSLGIVERVCGLFGCQDELYTNTIVQKDPHGSLLFLHTNMKPKWTMAVPADFEFAVRRWRVLSPGQDSLYEDFVALSHREFGVDLEKVVYGYLVEARCNAVLHNLTAAQETSAPALPWHIAQLANERLPARPWDTQLTQTFEDPGLTGDFLKDHPPTWFQHLKHCWNQPRFGKAKRWNGTSSELVPRSDVHLWRDHW